LRRVAIHEPERGLQKGLLGGLEGREAGLLLGKRTLPLRDLVLPSGKGGELGRRLRVLPTLGDPTSLSMGLDSTEGVSLVSGVQASPEGLG